jgi:hypothetical protein
MLVETLSSVFDSMTNRPFVTIHVAGLVIAIGAVAVTDVLTLVAKVRPKAMKAVVFFSPFLSMLVWAGFLILAVSGMLLVEQTRSYVSNPVFQQKMLFVGVVFVNGIVLNERIVPTFESLVERGIYEPPPRFKLIAAGSAIVSMLGWWGTMYIAYFRL